MKIFKKILAGVISAAVIVSALAVPTAANITATPRTESKSGRVTVGNKSFSYGGTLTASTTQASATASSGINLNLSVSLLAFGDNNGSTVYNRKSDAISGTRVTVQVDNTFTTLNGQKVTCDINEAQGAYTIGSIDEFPLTIK